MKLEQIAYQYGINHLDLIPVNEGFQNSVFKHRKSSRDFILRISSAERRSLTDLQNEIDFVIGLGHLGLPVSMPILSKNGKSIEIVGNHYITAFELAKGEPVDVRDASVWNNELFYNWGCLLGKMHNASRYFLIPKIVRPEWSEKKPDIFNLLQKITSESIRQRYIQQLQTLLGYQKDPDLFGLVHNDFHQGNFLVYNGKITIFDFDDCAHHWFAYDLAVSFYHAYWQASSFTPENTQFSKFFWNHFLEGYRTERTIKRELLEQIPIFLKIREIFLYVLFLEKWDRSNLEDWQEYTLNDLKGKIENDQPYSNVNFQEMIDNLN